MHSDKLLRMQDVTDRTGCKKSKIYALIRSGEFPKPVKIGECSHWPESKVSAWIAQRIAESEAPREKDAIASQPVER